MTIRLTTISKIISKAYDINPKFAQDMNHYLEQYAEYYFKIFKKDWIPEDKNAKHPKKT